MLVLDEADRMLDMGFIREVRKIANLLPKSRQSATFSATMAPEIAKLSKDILRNEKRIQMAPQGSTADRISQGVIFVEKARKSRLLHELLKDPALSRTIIFTRTKHAANRVATGLGKADILAEALHGDKSQNARQRALARFASGQVSVLVATDIAARGIDVDHVSHVINYELPDEAEMYVHRIGRTARAGSAGVAVSFCDAGERDLLRSIEKLIGKLLSVIDFGENIAIATDQAQAAEKAPRQVRKGTSREASLRQSRRRSRQTSANDQKAEERYHAFGNREMVQWHKRLWLCRA